MTTTFVLIKSRDGEGGEKRGLVVDWQDGGAVLHLGQEGKGRRETLANVLRGGERKERGGGRGREGEEGREREISALLLNTLHQSPYSLNGRFKA